MAANDPGSAREEAERLVATVLAAARLAGAGRAAGGRGEWGPVGAGPVGSLLAGVLDRLGVPSEGVRLATGSAECCVCPICRAMAALRDPSPEFAERLATGAGDLAAGVASLLRAFGSAAETTWTADRGSPTADPAAANPSGEPEAQVPTQGQRESLADRDEGDAVWRAVTGAGHDSPAPARDVWAAATTTPSADALDGTAPSADAPDGTAVGGVDRTGGPRPAED